MTEVVAQAAMALRQARLNSLWRPVLDTSLRMVSPRRSLTDALPPLVSIASYTGLAAEM